MTSREELFEEAVKAIYSSHNDVLSMGRTRMIVRAVLEKVHVPTEDEREALTELVGEDALASEIGRHKLVHVAVSRKSAFCICSTSVRSGTNDNIAWFEKHRAHAVAKWLKKSD